LACRSPARTVFDSAIFPRSRIVKRRPSDHGGIVNKLAVQRQSRPLLPELSELFTRLPAFAGLRPFFDNHLMRLEDETKDGIDEVRAELPGVEPTEDIEVTILDVGRRSRRCGHEGASRTGSRSSRTDHSHERCPCLPAPTRTTSAPLTTGGILTISVPLSDATPAEKHV
jgi:HSP20 family protein